MYESLGRFQGRNSPGQARGAIRPIGAAAAVETMFQGSGGLAGDGRRA
jgi:hypothetical protein